MPRKMMRRERRLLKLARRHNLRRSSAGRFHVQLPGTFGGKWFYPLRKVLRALGLPTRLIGVATKWNKDGDPVRGMLRAIPEAPPARATDTVQVPPSSSSPPIPPGLFSSVAGGLLTVPKP